MATRRGEAWEADSSRRRLLERKVLPRVVHELVEKDEQLQAAMRSKAGIVPPATAKQKAFARRLSISFDHGISKSDISELIAAKLAKKRR